MSEEKISVIIPVYNTESYLEACLNSLLAQTRDNWEAILVDDGSIDRSPEICDAYAEKDRRFRVIHKENGGVSAARNLALRTSSGHYVTFLDSDDWLEPDALECILSHFQTQDVDVVVTGYTSDYSNRSVPEPTPRAFTGLCGQKELIRQLVLVKDSYWAILCNKSFRRECIFPVGQEPVLFAEDVSFAEDQLWLLQVYKHARTACFDPKSIYHYVIRPTSAVGSLEADPDRILTVFHTFEEICRVTVEEHGIEPAIAHARLASQIYTWRLSKIYSAGHRQVNRYLLRHGKPYIQAMMQSSDFTKKQKRKTQIYLFLMRINFPPAVWNWVKYSCKKSAQKIFSKAKQFFMKFLPLSNTILLEGFPDYSDNTYWFAKYLAENTDVFQRYRMVWHIPKKEAAVPSLFGVPCISIARNESSWKKRIQRYYYLSTAKFIIDCNWPCRKRQSSQIRIHLCHGAPIKAVETYGHSLGEKDLLVVPSEYWREWFSNAMDQPMETTIPTGYPRNDILCQSLPRIPVLDGKKAIIWMPTFRQHARDKRKDFQMEQVLPLGFPLLHSQADVDALDDHLGQRNMILLLRPHPSQDTRVLHLESTQNIWIADDAFLLEHNLQLYELLAMTDGLITDYSSVYYDYLLTGKPIALAAEDYDQFARTFRIVIDYQKDLAADRLGSLEELKTFIDSISTNTDPHQAEREAACGRFNANRSGNACETLYRCLCTQFGL